MYVRKSLPLIYSWVIARGLCRTSYTFGWAEGRSMVHHFVPESLNKSLLVSQGQPRAGVKLYLLFISWIITVMAYIFFSSYNVWKHVRYPSLISWWRCLWCNAYRRRIWTRWHEFKSWTWLIAFHIALIPLGKVWIQLFSLQLWVNSRTD